MPDGLSIAAGISQGLAQGVTQGISLADMMQRRQDMEELRQRQAALQGIQTLGQILQLPGNLRNPLLDKFGGQFEQAFGVAIDPAFMGVLKKADEEQAASLRQILSAAGVQLDPSQLLQLTQDPLKALDFALKFQEQERKRGQTEALGKLLQGGEATTPSVSIPSQEETDLSRPPPVSPAVTGVGAAAVRPGGLGGIADAELLAQIEARQAQLRQGFLAAETDPQRNLLRQEIDTLEKRAERVRERERTRQFGEAFQARFAEVRQANPSLDPRQVAQQAARDVERRMGWLPPQFAALLPVSEAQPFRREDIIGAIAERWKMTPEEAQRQPNFREAYLNVARQVAVPPGGAVVGVGQLVIPSPGLPRRAAEPSALTPGAGPAGPAGPIIPLVERPPITEEVQKATPLSETDRGALTALNSTLGALSVLRTFSKEEIQAYAGLLNRPMQDVKLALQATAPRVFGNPDRRFAQFKVAMGRLKGTAFGEGGKQLTPFEASVVFTYTPTGNEVGGATEVMAKLDSLERFVRIARNARLELAKRGKGELDPAKLDQILRDEMARAGMAVPPSLDQRRQRLGIGP